MQGLAVEISSSPSKNVRTHCHIVVITPPSNSSENR
jgi:hypothetical protein